VSGLYRFVKNPMYLGVFCLIGSRALVFWSLPIAVYLLFVAACTHAFILLYEEPHLRRIFGEQYLSLVGFHAFMPPDDNPSGASLN
jgi:protein-S-isoprenylcysteine O-methyltransferase Ste14